MLIVATLNKLRSIPHILKSNIGPKRTLRCKGISYQNALNFLLFSALLKMLMKYSVDVSIMTYSGNITIRQEIIYDNAP